MKRTRGIAVNLSAIVAVGLLVGAIVFVLPKTLGAALSASSPVASGYPAPGSTPTAIATSEPVGGIQIGPASEIGLTNGLAALSQVYSPNIDGTTLAFAAKTSAGQPSIVLVALDTGQMQTISVQPSTGIGWLGFSGTDVAWLDVITEQNLNSRHFSLIKSGQQVQAARQIGNGTIREPDLKDGLLLWEELRNGTWGIFGYDLRANQALALGQDQAFAPHVCSHTWSIYLANRSSHVVPLGAADLHAHNWVNGQDILIGQIPMPPDMAVPHQIACDQNRVAWISVTPKDLISAETNSSTGQSVTVTTTVGVPSYHVYDLQTNIDQTLNGLGQQGFGQIFLRGDILVSTNGYIGYDLSRGAPFSLWPSAAFKQALNGPFALVLGADRLIWLSGGSGQAAQHLYSTPLMRVQ